jgi:hypothetical protein
MPAPEVWQRGAPIFRAWTEEYSKLENFNQRNLYSNRAGFEDRQGKSFKSRYHPDDFKAINKTMTVLRSYDRNLKFPKRTGGSKLYRGFEPKSWWAGRDLNPQPL